MVDYRSFCEPMNDPQLGEYEAYGIIAKDTEGSTRVIHDITCEKEKAEALAAVFNDEQLSLSQLDETIECFLYDFEV